MPLHLALVALAILAEPQQATSPAAPTVAPASPFKDWAAPVGTVIAAVIAGVFAVYQLRRSTAAERALEREKLVAARIETELAKTRSAAGDYRKAQALPF